MTSAFILQICIVLGALAWRGQRLRSSREFVPASGVRWTIIVALAALTVSLILHLPPGQPGGPHGLVAHLVQLGQNATLISTFAALQLLHLGYWPEDGRRYCGRWEMAIVAAILAVLTMLTAWAVITGDSLSYSAAALRRPVVAVFFLLPTLYLVYAAGSQVAYGVLYAVQSRSRLRAAALILTSIGMLFLLGACALRGFITVSAVTGHGFPDELRKIATVFIGIGNPAVAIGMVTPLIVRHLRRMQSRNQFNDLEPLWNLLTWTFPELVRPPLPDAPEAGPPTHAVMLESDGRSRRPSIGFLAAGRRSECLDGYILIRPYLAGQRPVRAGSRIEQAVREISAVTATEGGATPGETASSDPRQLVAVSRALKSRDLSWCQPIVREHA